MSGVKIQQTRKALRRLFIVLAFAVLAVGVHSNQALATETDWQNLTRLHYEDAASYSYEQHYCPNALTPVEVRGAGKQSAACVFGDTFAVRVARYHDSSDIISYAIAFPLDQQFTPIQGLCRGNQRCTYSAAADTFLIATQLQRGRGVDFIDNFSSHITKHNDSAPLAPYYTLSDDASFREIKNDNNEPVSANTVALSNNGLWAVTELYDNGFARLNLETGEFRRVVATNGAHPYGYGHDPIYELAITNDGTHIAIMGHNGGLSVYEITTSCGDTLSTLYEPSFAPGVEPCPAVGFDPNVFTTGFTDALTPTFTDDSHKLSFYVAAGDAYRNLIVTPKQYALTPTLSYAAFGDSFTSGEGETSDAFYEAATNTATNHCHVSTRSYPYLIGNNFSLPTHNKACSGALVGDVKSAIQSFTASTGNPSDPNNPNDPNDPLAPSSPSVISLSVGGNDVGIIEKLKSCLGIDTCEWVKDTNRLATANEIKAFFPVLSQLIQQTKQANPDAAIAVVGYPSVVNTSASATCGVVNNTLLNADERRYFDETVRYLNKIIQAAAYYTNTFYVDIENVLAGQRLCEASEQGMNGIRLGDDIAPISFLDTFKIIGAESFHPTPWAHAKIAQAAVNQLTPNWPHVTCERCTYSDTLLEASSYWTPAPPTDNNPEAQSPRTQMYERFLDKTLFIKNSSLDVSASLPKNSFAPNSSVSIELHSNEVQLAQTKAQADGSIAATVTLPANYQGYHTVHIYGESPSGVSLDLYQGVVIAEESAAVPEENTGGQSQSNTPSTPSTPSTSNTSNTPNISNTSDASSDTAHAIALFPVATPSVADDVHAQGKAKSSIQNSSQAQRQNQTKAHLSQIASITDIAELNLLPPIEESGSVLGATDSARTVISHANKKTPTAASPQSLLSNPLFIGLFASALISSVAVWAYERRRKQKVTDESITS